jgi:phage terminase large subunit-like protein
LCALSSDGKGKHGYNGNFVIFDEFHTFDASEQELYDALTTGSGLRREPCFVIITTAGVDEYSLCGREYDYTKKVLNGTIVNPSYLPLIYELPKDANWCDETLWHLANPILGLILDIDFLREEKQKALDLPSEQTKFRRLYMNQWVNSKSQWIPVEKWDLCKWDGEPIAA